MTNILKTIYQHGFNKANPHIKPVDKMTQDEAVQEAMDMIAYKIEDEIDNPYRDGTPHYEGFKVAVKRVVKLFEDSKS